jgi:hypothetical protein
MVMTTRDDIICFEEGSGQPPWTGLATSVWDEMGPLTRLSDEGVIAIQQCSGVISVSGKDRVGLVVLPSGRRLVVYPTAVGPLIPAIAVRPLLMARVGDKAVSIDSMELPMSAGPEACLTALRGLMSPQ